MKVFVASWDYPQSNSAAGFALYKLLKNSKHDYVICSAQAYDPADGKGCDMETGKNQVIHTVPADSIDSWANECCRVFDELSKKDHFDCVVTISNPPESIAVGNTIKAKYNGIKWIAAFNEPAANAPADITSFIVNNQRLSEEEKTLLRNALRSNDESLLERWEAGSDRNIIQMCKARRLENLAKKNADVIAAPSSEQLKYMLGSDHWLPKFKVVPYCYDSSVYGSKDDRSKSAGDKTDFLYVATDNSDDSLAPFIRAVRKLRENSSPAADRIHVKVAGAIPDAIKHMVLNYYLDDVFTFEEWHDYGKLFDSITETDWILYADKFFGCVESGGAVNLSEMTGDFVGSGRPILALADEYTPAGRIAKESGGTVCCPEDIEGLSMLLESIVGGTIKTERNELIISSLDSKVIADKFDAMIREVCSSVYHFSRTYWPEINKSSEEKILSVCVPSYNAQVFLDRCICSLIDHRNAEYMEVLVVNDGSKDFTPDIGAEYERRYPGIVRLINKENGGHGSAINAAIRNAKGKYFKNVDSDDWVESRNLAALIDYLREHDEIDAVSSDYDEIDLMTGLQTHMKAGASIEYGREYTFDEINADDVYFTIHSVTFRTSILKKMGIELQHHTFFVDCEYILFPVPLIKKFVFLPDIIYKYSRGNPDQSVDTFNMVKRYDHHDRVLKRCIEYEKTAALSDSQTAYYDSILKRLLFTHFALSLVYDSDKKRGMERAKEFYGFLKTEKPEMAKYVVKEIPFARMAYISNFNTGINENLNRDKGYAVAAAGKMKKIVKKLKTI